MRVEEFLVDQLNDARSHWSIGTFGAIAEFCSLVDEHVAMRRDGGVISAITERGGISVDLSARMHPFASESLAWEGWSQRLSLCLTDEEARMNRRAVLTELAVDDGALREADRDGTLFDLGLAAPHVDFCIRVQDGELKRVLRGQLGRPLYDTGNPALTAILKSSPHRVFVSKVGRVEVFQRIPVHGETSPQGPHTHVLPKLLGRRRTHPATEPVPEGMVPCIHVYPWHPADVSLGKQPHFDAEQHSYLQAVLRSFGDPKAVSTKDAVTAEVLAGKKPHSHSFAKSRFDRANIRIALRQLRAAQVQSLTLADWISKYDLVQAERHVPTCSGVA